MKCESISSYTDATGTEYDVYFDDGSLIKTKTTCTYKVGVSYKIIEESVTFDDTEFKKALQRELEKLVTCHGTHEPYAASIMYNTKACNTALKPRMDTTVPTKDIVDLTHTGEQISTEAPF